MRTIIAFMILMFVVVGNGYAIDVEEREGVTVMSSYSVGSLSTIDSKGRDVYVDEGEGFYLYREAGDFTLEMDKLIKAFALVVLNEINILRTEASLSERSTAQLKTAVKNKYDAL